MVVEIVTTGTELLLGQIVNTNAAYLAESLNKLGFDVLYQTTVGDNHERMAEVLKIALARADIVITSGGLGPTQGDITKFVAAKLCGRQLYVDEKSLEHIRRFAMQRGFPMTENNVRQAMIPQGAVVFANACGTAPGVAIEQAGRVIIHLPGPPNECQDMFSRSVTPYLLQKYGTNSVIMSRVLHTFGIGESLLEEKIMDLIKNQHNPTLALLVSPSGVIIRITAKADDAKAAKALLGAMEKEIRQRVGAYIYAADERGMEDVVGEMLTEKGLHIACAESCTGGLVTSRLTDVPGSSRYVHGAVVSYTNEIKEQALQVSAETLRCFGAVSKQTAREMAQGIRRSFAADIGLAVTGLAGPGGGSPEKPVGLVYIAVTGKNGTKICRKQFSGSRKAIKYRASQMALDAVRQYIQEM